MNVSYNPVFILYHFLPIYHLVLTLHHLILCYHPVLYFILFLRYQPGDVAVVCPQNMPDSVDDFISHMKLDGDAKFTIHKNDPGLSKQFLYTSSLL